MSMWNRLRRRFVKHSDSHSDTSVKSHTPHTPSSPDQSGMDPSHSSTSAPDVVNDAPSTAFFIFDQRRYSEATGDSNYGAYMQGQLTKAIASSTEVLALPPVLNARHGDLFELTAFGDAPQKVLADWLIDRSYGRRTEYCDTTLLNGLLQAKSAPYVPYIIAIDHFVPATISVIDRKLRASNAIAYRGALILDSRLSLEVIEEALSLPKLHLVLLGETPPSEDNANVVSPVPRLVKLTLPRLGKSIENPSPQQIEAILRSLPGGIGSSAILETADDVYIQTAGSSREGFILEHHLAAQHYCCIKATPLLLDEVLDAFLSFNRGDDAFKTAFAWESKQL